MSVVLTELHYLPSIAYFQQLLTADALLLDAHEHYHKQTYRNRALLLTAQGPQPLTVPVLDGARAAKVCTSDIEIDYRQNWRHRHLRTMQTAYGASPYFSYYVDYLQDIYGQKPARLWDLNLALLHLLLRCLHWPLPIELTTEYLTPSLSHPFTNSLLDKRDFLTPKGDANGAGPDSPSYRPYPQVFGTAFVPGMSMLDLLFMQGPAAGQFL
ncbi:WbqC family protein [Hymenobacter sp. H14-R3]|uniref:WbqC family protein n=1 Tax=Hymenobacter sp. H14-R3 TaxID=3046308 RepID=UPI0024BB681B|nr:WbqC family protein [Hymenobacter sp. H14-R3]MDJ0365616.1 WbqC family protein [Hymenobacter sp. H14-R3]